MARSGGYRHLVFLIDGTWLWPGSDSTLDVYSNIYHLNTLIEEKGKDGKAQIVFYARGLGGVDGPRRYTAGGFSYGIDELVADLYVNLCSNYEFGDKIYILGFSRGAVAARALSGMISKGILDAKHINKLEAVWSAYTGGGDVILPGAPRDAKGDIDNSASYREFCSNPQPKIEFVGVFDTVSGGHGLTAIAQKLRLRERKVESCVRNAVQILALDEERRFFRPIYWTGLKEPVEPSQRRYFEQIWMPGVHSDIGGAYRNRFIGNVSLVTILDRLDAKTEIGLNIAAAKKDYNTALVPGDFVHIHNEFTKLWRLFSPFAETREPDTNNLQHLHPLANLLDGRRVKYKAKESPHTYRIPAAFRQFASGPEFLTNHFKSVATLI